jgi:hypothetical protein
MQQPLGNGNRLSRDSSAGGIMGHRQGAGSEAQFSAYVEELPSVIGHAGGSAAVPFSSFSTFSRFASDTTRTLNLVRACGTHPPSS